MNAAFLLITTAWFAGADAAPTKPPEQIKPPANPNTAPLVVGGASGYGDCNSCDVCDECGGHKRRHKFKGLFSKHKSCDCGCEAAPCCAPAPAPATCGCDTCDTGCGKHGLLSRLKGKFHRKSECCDTCDTCGDSGAEGIAAPVLPKVQTMPKTNEPPAQRMPIGNEPSLKPIGLDAAPKVVPNVTVETEKSPF